MSKHQKEVSTGWRSFNPKSAIRNPKWAVLALAAVAVVAGGTQAWADAIRYDNPAGPGHFDWRPLVAGTEVILSILDGPADQDAVVGDSGAYRHRNRMDIGYGTDVRRAGPTGEGPQYAIAPSGGLKLLFPVDEAELIPTTGADGFTSGAASYWPSPEPGDPYTFLTAGVETYLGVTFDLGAGLQYGWIGVTPEWITSEGVDVLVLDAFAWGYETEAGVPIAAGVPEPGTLALLAMGAVGVLSRRRR